jgi:antitoxin (DNA-binding transcriptional repressor) of toxin-antitoxin stability system
MAEARRDRIALSKAKNRLSELIERVQSGEVIVITRRGKAVAQLMLPQEADNRRARDALVRLSVSRKGVSLGGLKARDLINEGRG